MILKSSEQLVCPTTPAKGHHLRLGDGLRVRHVRLPHCYKRTKHGPSVPLANIPEVVSDVTGECVLMQTGPDQHEVQTQVERNTAHLQAPSFTHTHLLHCCCFPHTRARHHPHPACSMQTQITQAQVPSDFPYRLSADWTPSLVVVSPRSSVPRVCQFGGLSE